MGLWFLLGNRSNIKYQIFDECSWRPFSNHWLASVVPGARTTGCGLCSCTSCRFRVTGTSFRFTARFKRYFCWMQLEVIAKLLAAERTVIWLTVFAAFSQLT